MVLPVTSKWVDCSLFHPEFVRRLEALFADPRVRGKAKICSGGRTFNQQKAFYDKYKAGKGNLAANPSRRFGPKGLNGVGMWKGSWHQQQIDGWVYAVDVRLSRGLKWGAFHDVAEDYGIRKTVPSENWHMQPRYTNEWFPAPALDEGYLIPPTPPAEPELPDFAAILRLIDKVGDALEMRPLRRRSQGDPVVMVQRRLADLDFKVGNPDGKYGWRTTRAVVAFQRVERLACDGCVGRKTWERMWGVED